MIKITLDRLNEDSVSVLKQSYIIQGDLEYLIGEPLRKAYVNSNMGRLQVDNEVIEPYKSVIFMMWGDEPTINEDMD